VFCGVFQHSAVLFRQDIYSRCIAFACCVLLTCSRELDLPASATDKARERDFEIAGYSIEAPSGHVLAPRVVRVGLIQNRIVLPTTDPVLKQVGCIVQLQAITQSVPTLIVTSSIIHQLTN